MPVPGSTPVSWWGAGGVGSPCMRAAASIAAAFGAKVPTKELMQASFETSIPRLFSWMVEASSGSNTVRQQQWHQHATALSNEATDAPGTAGGARLRCAAPRS